jgi:hypothetical protein
MLPIRRVVLYKHGVGFFERRGEVEGDTAFDLHFKEAEMDDVLKSLTTLDLTSGVISSISYEAKAPVERRLAEVGISVPDSNALTGLIAQLKGAPVAAERASGRVQGVIVGVETTERREGQVVSKLNQLVLLVNGALMAIELSELRQLELLDEDLRRDVQHVLDVLISAKRKDRKKLTIFAKGAGRRELLASYVVETPVWKTSYRMLLEKDAPFLQGWAVVDNTQDEDWDDVQLSLVAGLPISFIHDLYSPRYRRRPVVRVREEAATAPPIVESGIPMPAPALEEAEFDMEVGMSVEDEAPMPSYAPRAAAAPPPPPRMTSAAVSRSTQVQTRTVEAADLFSYELTTPVSVKRGQSALVPILGSRFDGRRVAHYNAEVREKNPMSAVLFRNTTGLTLEGGPITVFEDGSYAGEAMLETTKPGEERLLPFAVDLGCLVQGATRTDSGSVHLAKVVNGVMEVHRFLLQRRSYEIHNKTDRDRELYLDHRISPGQELVETPDPVEKTENFYRFKLELAARAQITFTVTERSDEVRTQMVVETGLDQLQAWYTAKWVDAATKEALGALVRQHQKSAEVGRRIAVLELQRDTIVRNQDRVRQNLKALGQTSDQRALSERYVAELSAEEDKLKALAQEVERLRAEKQKLDADVRARLGQVRCESRLD